MRCGAGGNLALAKPSQYLWRRYVAVHSHHSNAGFSDLDAAVLVANTAIHMIAAAGIDGTWYLLSKRPHTVPTGPAPLAALVRAMVVEMRRAYLPAAARTARVLRPGRRGTHVA